MKKTVIISVFLLFGIIINSAFAQENVGNMFGISTDHQPYNFPQNPFCNTDSCNQCTAFAWGRAMDRLGKVITFNISSYRHACRWWIDEIITNGDITYESVPRENSFAVWASSSGQCCRTYPCTVPTGHVAYVEKVEGDNVYINEANIVTHNEDGGYDKFTKKLSVSEMSNRPSAGGVLQGYIYLYRGLHSPFSDYYYWNFDTQGTEDWNARNALNQGIYRLPWPPYTLYWQIGDSSLNSSVKRQIESPTLNAINTNDYNAIEITFRIDNTFLERVEASFMFDGDDEFRPPQFIEYVYGPRTLGSENTYRGRINNTGEIKQVRIDFDIGCSAPETCKIFIDKVRFLKTIRVPSDQPTIQAGIDAANDGDEILVADDTWTGAGNKNLDFGGKAITLSSENGPDNCIIDCENDGRGFYFHSGEGSDSVVSGFTITNGQVGWYESGAGINCVSSSPTITNCYILYNTADYHGGGINCESSSAVVRDCIIERNSSTYEGGGFYCDTGSPIIENCEINNNESYMGGGFSLWYSSPTIISCSISENTAGTQGGGGLGGGIRANMSSLIVKNCIISNNFAGYGGGGISSGGSSDDMIINSLILNNQAASYGGGFACQSSTLFATNCTIFGNNATYGGGGVFSNGSYPKNHKLYFVE